MLELPEIETIRRDLEREVGGKKIKTVELTSLKSVSHHRTKKELAGLLEHTKINGVSRRGMLLLFSLDSDQVLVALLSGKARFRRAANREPTEKGTEVVITFTQHGQLRLIDAKGDAELFVIDTDQIDAERPELANLGFDPVEEPISWTHFGRRLLARTEKLKSVLMDPTFVVGIGPMYSDEILFEAGLRYDRTPDALSTQEIRRLYRAVVEVIHDAVKHRGTSLTDDGYSDVFGKPGGYQEYLAVFGRAGQMSPRARGEIVRSRFGGGWTYYCEQTQG